MYSFRPLLMVILVLCATLMLVGGSSSGSVWEELLGETMYRWAEDGQQVEEVSTADVLDSKKTVALYFSASWCRPCQQFTPMLTKFYNEMNKKGKAFEIVWLSQDRSTEDFVSYYQKMPWLAMPVDQIQERLPALSSLYQAKGIPHLVVLDGDAKVITTDGRTMVAKDPYGLEFPWKPKSLASLIPKPVRRILASQVDKAMTCGANFLKGVASGLAPDKVLHFIGNKVLPAISGAVVKIFNIINERSQASTA